MLLGRSEYGALNTYLKELGMAFCEMGYEVEFFDGTQKNYGDKLYDITSANEYKAIFTCNAILTGWEKLVLKNSIFCCLMFDHPVQLYERIQVADENVVIIHCDRCGAEYIARYCKNVGSVGFVPLSGSYVNERTEYNRRKYDLIFTGSYNDSEAIYRREIDTLSEQDIIVADILIKRMKERPAITQQDALGEYYENTGQSVSDYHFHNIMGRLRGVEAYMRAWIREKVIRAITDGGIQINIFGRDWEKFVCSHPENIIRMEGCGDISLHAVANARISLNVMPWFRGGFQERIATAMLCGAVALTDSSSYIEDNFTDGEDIVLFDPAKSQEIPSIIHAILDDDKRASDIARRGYEKAIRSHTWKNRALDVMEIVDDSIEWLESARQVSDYRKVSVSVIVPVYNAESTLVECLSGLVNQTLGSIEIIIVNDCSTDGSGDILQRCKLQYPDKVFVINSEKNVGPGGARNIGIQNAHGEYIGFADSDDIIDISMFEKMYAKAVSGNYDIVDAGYYKEETDQCILYTGDDCEGLLNADKRSKLIFGGGGYIWSKLFRAGLLLENDKNFRENTILEDCDFMFEMFAKAKNIGTIQEVLYVYKYYETSISRNTEANFYSTNVIRALNAIYNRLSVLDNYEDIRIAAEAVMLKLYSCAVNMCIVKYCNKRIFGGEQHIARLHSVKDKVIHDSYDDNGYLLQELSKEDIAIMKTIDRLY